MNSELKVFYKTNNSSCLCLKHAILKIKEGKQVDGYVSEKKDLQCSICFVENHEYIKSVNTNFRKSMEQHPDPEPDPEVVRNFYAENGSVYVVLKDHNNKYSLKIIKDAPIPPPPRETGFSFSRLKNFLHSFLEGFYGSN